MVAKLATEAIQHAAIVVKRDTINTNAQRLLKTTSFSKTIEYLWMRMGKFPDLDGMEVTPIHGASGMSIASIPTPSKRSVKRKRLLLLPAAPPLVSVAFAEVPSIPVGNAIL